MNIYLTIVVVLCAVGASRALKEVPKLVTSELNHNKNEDRVTQLECTFEKQTDAEVLQSLEIQKKKDTGFLPIFKRSGTDAPTKSKIDGEIAEADIEIPDNTKNIVKVKKATKVDGEYKCVTKTDLTGTQDSTPNLVVKKDRDAVAFNIIAKGAKDGAKDKFESGNELEASLEYSLAEGSTLVKAEFQKDDKLYFRYTLDGDKKEPQDGAKDAGIPQDHVINGAHDGTAKKVTVSIKDANKDTQGKFKAIFTYKTGAEDHFTSNEVPLTYNGAASAMISFASISTLLLALVAVRSNL